MEVKDVEKEEAVQDVVEEEVVQPRNGTPRDAETTAYENSRLYKEKVRAVHDKNIKRREFHPGDLVLLYNSRLRLMQGKLRSRWEGPYRVEKAEPYVVFHLSHPSNPNVLKVNGHYLKLYHGKKMKDNKELEIFLLEDPPIVTD
ncbi:uncharacterized protein LOC107607359 [Arachis ipaensis]|uniref:uncharacterized protein LOC107607359 n=1 Tax=Arachis ipaensis TaxID=130454 RepID=UPI0007AF1DB1|nr:uncharacterized protein LOC107607359 [Arachis ipaensis]